MSNHNESSGEDFNIKEFILTAFSYKYFYIGCIILSLAIAYLVNRFSPVIYEVSSLIGPIDDKRSSLLSSKDLFSGMGSFTESENFENDIKTLRSFSLVSKTLNELNLEVGHFIEKNKIFKQRQQIYSNSPYIISIDKSHIQPINTRFYIDILDNSSFRLTSFEDEVTLYNYVDNKIISRINSFQVDTICRFNELIINEKFKFSVSRNTDFSANNSNEEMHSYFEFFHLDYLTKQYLERLAVEPVSLKSSLILVYFQGDNVDLTIDFLNKYLQSYLDENLLKKNKIAINTINFIDSQISEISDSLALSESKLMNYRSTNQVMDLSYQGQRAFEQMTQIENDRSNLQIQERYYNYVLDYFNNNKDVAGIAPPSAANVTDPIMNQLIMELLTLNSQRANILSNKTEKNLFLGQIENQIRLQIKTIIENVTNNLNTLNLSLNELNYRSDKLSKEISKLPKTELNMVSIQRKFNLSDAIYTFMLQKRSESAITMASNYPDYEILDPARQIDSTVLSPKKLVNWLIALFLGFTIPTLFIMLKNFFNSKITSIKDAERLSGGAVLSVIFNNYNHTEAVVYESPGSSVAESFRNLRTSMFRRFRSEPLKTILITSAQPQDGKSFVSFNLAASIASVGYKTIILDCDMRRPTLHIKFKEVNTSGLTNYLLQPSSIDNLIHNTFIKNLSFIPAGPILPNSSEFIESGTLDELINYLKKKYDYVIFDTTPAGLISDSVLMMKYASLVLLVCRNGYTRKDDLSDVLKLFKTNKVENFELIFNDLDIKESRYGRYKNYYLKNQGSE
jgi:tyrosine-protein kinase Etk/Wzc